MTIDNKREVLQVYLYDNLQRDSFRTIPLWIKLFGIPSAHWTEEDINEIASTIGVPLKTDLVTRRAQFAKFARVYIAKEVETDFLDSMEIITACDQECVVRFEYSWRPRICNICKLYGHIDVNCPTKSMRKKNGNKFGKSIDRKITLKQEHVK